MHNTLYCVQKYTQGKGENGTCEAISQPLTDRHISWWAQPYVRLPRTCQIIASVLSCSYIPL